MTWYPNLEDLKSIFVKLRDKHPKLEKDYILGGGERKLEGILDSLRYGLPMMQLDFWNKTVLFLRDLTSAHAYSNGNHRFAYISTKIFLRKNDYRINLSDDEGVIFTELIENRLNSGNFKIFARWLKSRCIKIS